MEELGEMDSHSFACRRWNLFKGTVNADKTLASIMGVLAEKLSVLTFDGAEYIFSKKEKVCIEDIGTEKTAVFVNVSDTDRAFDRIASLFYTQALQVLCNGADNAQDGCLKIPVRLILDDYAANACIPDFEKVISTIRSREISVSVILQSISQLESIHGHANAMTIISNCDTLLYLGGNQDVGTAKYIAVKADKAASTILNMPLEQAWLFQRGQKPKIVEKYRLQSHSRYPELAGESYKEEIPDPELHTQKGINKECDAVSSKEVDLDNNFTY